MEYTLLSQSAPWFEEYTVLVSFLFFKAIQWSDIWEHAGKKYKYIIMNWSYRILVLNVISCDVCTKWEFKKSAKFEVIRAT